MGKPKEYDFSGWATKFNRKCSDGRTILHNAFINNDGATVPLVWNHDHQDQDSVLGHAFLENRNDGVYAYCSFNETARGKHAKELVKHGDIVSLSIYANQLKQNNKMEVIHGNIREVSLVLAGANPGAYIENVLVHSADGNEIENEEEAVIHMFEDSDDALELFHAEEKQGENKMADKKETQEQEGKTASDKTLKEVVDTMNEEQKEALYILVAAALEEKEKELEDEGDKMKHNAFDDENDIVESNEELMHTAFLTALSEAKKGGHNGSLKECLYAAIEATDELSHGITNIGNLFPEFKPVGKPETVDRDQTWVGRVMNGVHHVPFAKVKSWYFNITQDEARAKGYVKGNQKVEEVVLALKRSTTPQTVYKLQKIDRDDVIDITDFDVVAYLRGEMRGKLDEELARAMLIGDGRDVLSPDKIKTDHIVPIWQDNAVYTVNKAIVRAEDKDGNPVDDYAFAKQVIKEVVKARKDYKGSGNPVFFTTEDMLTSMLLIEDLNGRVIYDTIDKLKTALRVSDIVTVPVMENQSRTAGGFQYNLLAVLVNLNDYAVGADKGGEVNMFDDFDINYNKYEYLIETRISGALTKPYSAITFEEKVSF